VRELRLVAASSGDVLGVEMSGKGGCSHVKGGGADMERQSVVIIGAGKGERAARGGKGGGPGENRREGRN